MTPYLIAFTVIAAYCATCWRINTKHENHFAEMREKYN